MRDIGRLAHELIRLRTRHVFGIPGEGPSLELLNQLEQGGCVFYSVGHEGAAALMAGGYGRVTATPGVCLSIKGPGFSNLLAGIASNWLDHNPCLSLSESYGPGSSPHRMHKRLAHASMVKPVVKAYADNPSPELITYLWNLCLAEEPGPIHVDISATLTGEAYESYSIEQPLMPLPWSIIQTIGSSRRPVVIAGAMASRREWRKMLNRLRIPVFTTVAGKGAIDETGLWAAGVFTNGGGVDAPERAILPMADLAIGLGLRTSELLDAKSLPIPLIVLDELADQAGGLGAVEMVPAKDDAIHEALQLLLEKDWGQTEIQKSTMQLRARFESDRWLPADALVLAQALLPPDTRFILDTGSFCTIAEHALTAKYPEQVMGSACGRSMGISLPIGIGSLLGLPGVPAVVVVGDGGVRMYPETMTIAIREKMPLIVLVMNDGHYGSVRQAAVANGFTEKPVQLDGCRWSAVFHAMGCASERVESLPALANALKSWYPAHGPLVLDLIFDAEAYLEMTAGLR
jgi:acetolactate synthase-1/2/3 large subunit